MRRKMSSLQLAEMAGRLAEEKQQPVEEVARLVRIDPHVMIRWALQGRSGRYLDAIIAPDRSLLTSLPAVTRFLAAIEAEKNRRPELAIAEVAG